VADSGFAIGKEQSCVCVNEIAISDHLGSLTVSGVNINHS